MDILTLTQKPLKYLRRLSEPAAALLGSLQLVLFVLRELAAFFKYKLTRLRFADLMLLQSIVMTVGILLGSAFPRFFKKLAVLLGIGVLLSSIIFLCRLVFNKK